MVRLKAGEPFVEIPQVIADFGELALQVRNLREVIRGGGWISGEQNVKLVLKGGVLYRKEKEQCRDLRD